MRNSVGPIQKKQDETQSAVLSGSAISGFSAACWKAGRDAILDKAVELAEAVRSVPT
jgi:hypothetical protein